MRAALDLYRGDLLPAGTTTGPNSAIGYVATPSLPWTGSSVCSQPTSGSPAALAEAVIGYAETARVIDPLAEPVPFLMGLYEARGDRARALRVYHEGVAALADKLGVTPSAETRAAYEALLPAAEAAPATSATSPFVGRQPERRRLGEAWRAARDGEAQLVLVSGEPGVGKTRLVEELRQWAERRGAATAAARSYAVEGALPYAPVVSWLRAPSIARWRARLDSAYLAQLARLLPEAAEHSAPDDPQARLLLLDAAARALLAGPEAVLLVADNLPAADAQTLQFLHYLLRAEPQARLLVVATGRLAETDSGDPIQALLAGLRTIGRASTLDLHRLDAGKLPCWPSGSPDDGSATPTTPGCTRRPAATRCFSSRRCATAGPTPGGRPS